MAKKKTPTRKAACKTARTAEVRAGGPDLPYIVEGLRPLAVELAAIKPDPRNARRHDDANLAAIRASLKKFGQRQPLVVNKSSGLILAGNARHMIAGELGWTHVAVVYVEDDAASATGFALADNRTAELATWDDELLTELLAEIRAAEASSAEDGDADLVAELHWDHLLADVETVGAQTTSSQAVPELWQVVANCKGEAQQKELYERLKGEGYDVKLLVI